MPELQCFFAARRFKAAANIISGGKIMFQNAIIDVAIGLILMYLMLSLLCTVVNEYISTKLNLRSKTLRDALQKLIDDPALLKNFYEHGLITSSSQASGSGAQSLIQAIATWVGQFHRFKNQVPPPTTGGTATATPTEAEHPSYLASGTVALALLDSLLKKTPGTQNVAGIATAVGLLTGPTIKDALNASLLKAGNDIDKLQQGIATWFDDSMDRLSGAYKRKMKWIAMLIGLLVAIAFNADSFNVATTLWNDPDRRASTIAIATEVAKKNPSQQPVQTDLNKAVTDTEKMLRSLPVGWNCPAPGPGKTFHYWTCAQEQFGKLTPVQMLGWILTALALSLGAPFWFDMLNKFINLRGAGGKPQRQDQK
jgi:hypothetical protein